MRDMPDVVPTFLALHALPSGTDRAAYVAVPLALAIAVRSYGLSPEQAILAATRGGAWALGLDDRGVLRARARADLVAWDRGGYRRHT
ncbi:MAG: amidohydrolase family protein [Myxococcota bacterium]|nr:amidohydrolase family protein [Myxococcota bacterium]